MGSFQINMTAIFSYAADIFNQLMPIAAVAIGISMGVGLIGLVTRLIKSSFGGM